jgi:hypothetical protein
MSLRDRLARKRRRVEEFSWPVSDEIPAREREVQQAQAALLLAEARHPADPDDPNGEPHEDVRRLRRQVEVAEAALRECFEVVTFQAIDSDELEVLTQESAERRKAAGVKDDDEDAEDPEYDAKDPESFVIRLIAASVVVPPGEERMTEKEWVGAIHAPEWTAQDRMALVGKALAANSRRNYDIPKGSAPTRR